MTRTHLWLLLAAGMLLLGCDAARGDDDNDDDGADGGSDTDVDGDSDADSDSSTGPSGAGCESMDILFVIDNSGSMSEEQANLASNFPGFIDVLENYTTPNNTPIEYRVGVTTTAVTRSFTQKLPPPFPAMPTSTSGEDGALVGQQSCMLGAYPWVEGSDPDVTSKFSCMAAVGTNGSGTEMPFAALQQALGEQSAEPDGPNMGFYRKDEDSLLVIVVITDEDDCSVDDGGMIVTTLAGGSDCDETQSIDLYQTEDTHNFINEISGGEGKYVLVGIAGGPPNGCESSGLGSAAYAKRLEALVLMSGDYGVYGDICAGDLSTSLFQALEVMQFACDDFPGVE